MTSATPTDASKIELDANYPDKALTIKELKHTIKITPAEGGNFVKTFEDDSEHKFTSLQFHFHAPSENTIDGRHYDLEMHIVHGCVGCSYAGAVIGMMFDTEKGGSGFNPFIEQVSAIFEE